MPRFSAKFATSPTHSPRWAEAAASAFFIGVFALALARATVAAPGLAVAGVVLAAGGVLVFLRPEVLLLVVFAGLPWESDLAYPSATLTVLAIIRLILPSLFVIRAFVRRDRLVLPRFLAPLGIFLLLTLAALMLSPNPSESMTKTVRYLIFAASLFAAVQMLADRTMTMWAIRILTVTAAAAALYAVEGFLFGGLTRAAGPITDPNDFSYLLITVIPLALFLFVEDRKWRALWGVAVGLLLVGTLASLSRGAYVGLGGLLLWGILTRRVSAVALLGGLTVAAVLVVVGVAFFGSTISTRLSGRQQVSGASGNARAVFWEAAAEMTIHDPLFGVGPDRYDDERDKYLHSSPVALVHKVSDSSQTLDVVRGAHDTYLEVAAENGVPALLLFCYFLLGIWTSLRDYHGDHAGQLDLQGRRLATALQGALITAILAGIFLSGQLESPFWIVGALAGALTARSAVRTPASRRRIGTGEESRVESRFLGRPAHHSPHLVGAVQPLSSSE